MALDFTAMPTEEDARTQGLFGSDTIARASHGAYKGKINLAGYVAELNNHAFELLSGTPIVRDRAKIQQECADLEAGKQSTCSAIFARMRDIYVEHFMIGAAFELHLKAALLRHGFVVHVIDKKQPAYRDLAEKQNVQPVPVADLIRISGFRYSQRASTVFGIDMPGLILPGLSEISLSFSAILEPSYVHEMKKPEYIIKMAKRYRLLRNHIHLPGDLVGGRDYSPTHIEQEASDIVSFINSEIVDDTNSFLDTFGLTTRHGLSRIS
jgi:hypothetical protein